MSGYDTVDERFADILTSNDEVSVTYDANPNADGSVITVRRTVWKRARNRKDQHILWIGDVAVFERGQVPGFIQDLASCL